jgi:hypothetical protein
MAAHFWDLPKTVRDQIYRLHLVKEDRITEKEHGKIVTERFEGHYQIPAICAASPLLEEEAAPIYFGENHFEFLGTGNRWSSSASFVFAVSTHPRHAKFVKRLTLNWPDKYANSVFNGIARMKQLEQLHIGVNEAAMARSLLSGRHYMPWYAKAQLTQQQLLAIQRHPGLSELLTISGVPDVQFVKMKYSEGDEYGGPVPGGFFELHVKPKLMRVALPPPKPVKYVTSCPPTASHS